MSLYGVLAGLYNRLIPGWGMHRERGLAYGEHPRHRLDVYRPAEEAGHARPVIVFFYGGAWDSGHRKMYYFAARSLVDRGYVVAVPDYRLYPEVRYPDFLEDAAGAVSWVGERIDQHGGDPDRIFLMGHSAGAYNAAMVAYDKHRRDPRSFAGTVRGFIGLAGLYDFLPLDDDELRRIFDSAEDLQRTQPVNFVERTSPPALLLAGKNDERVNPWHSRSLARALHQTGVDYRFELLEGAGHIEIMMSLGPGFRARYPTLDAVDAFVTDTIETDEAQRPVPA